MGVRLKIFNKTNDTQHLLLGREGKCNENFISSAESKTHPINYDPFFLHHPHGWYIPLNPGIQE